MRNAKYARSTTLYAIRLILALSVMLLAFSVFYAAETGKIAGRVIDATTNQPLIGVNVVVEGSELGAPTDANGAILITNIRVGTYSVLASYMG